jgi:NitT/TauT family transport system substrate-binding protein
MQLGRIIAVALVLAALGLQPALAQGQKVTIPNNNAALIAMPFYIAIQKGYFKDEGLDVQLVDIPSGPDATKMLASGRIDFQPGQLLDGLFLRQQGIKAKSIALLTSRYTASLVVRKAVANEITSVAKLKGRTVGVTGVGGGTWLFLMYLAKKNGLQPDDINVVPVGNGPSALNAVISGRVDALSFVDPENFKLVQDGEAVYLADMTNEAVHQKEIGGSYVNNQVLVLEDYAKKNPKNVQMFVNGIQRALTWARSQSPDEVAAVVRSFPNFAHFEQDIFIGSLKKMLPQALPTTAVITREAFDNNVKIPLGAGTLKTPVPYEEIVDNSFAEAAAKALAK